MHFFTAQKCGKIPIEMLTALICVYEPRKLQSANGFADYYKIEQAVVGNGFRRTHISSAVPARISAERKQHCTLYYPVVVNGYLKFAVEALAEAVEERRGICGFARYERYFFEISLLCTDLRVNSH